MTSDIVIRAEGLGKKYIIGHQSADRLNTFRDVITQNVRNFVRGAKDMAQGKAIVAGDDLEEFWALKDVNFEIKRGDVVGIIGRNGAGKSTLLKVLSRITEPTEGRVEIKGRVASLLEVGTGFHPELSGRENVYLNGAILGMTRAEINRKFDEIVDFSGVEKFLDTPVKRYSSGMYVRLAFAVAAHLEPEILVVDEVLAVGDAEFQKKCLGKMQDVAGQGRTVLFVSHNMAAVRSLCQHGLFLSSGQTGGTTGLPEALRTYENSAISNGRNFDKASYPDCELSLESLGSGTIRISGHSPFGRNLNFTIGLIVTTLGGVEVLETSSSDHKESPRPASNEFAMTLALPIEDIRPGDYEVSAFCYLQNEAWLIEKSKGPCIRVSCKQVRVANNQYYDRPDGYGPILKWNNFNSQLARPTEVF
jgi:ABC-type polysaccharide/polyol phosphate transport system ATPase subunit